MNVQNAMSFGSSVRQINFREIYRAHCLARVDVIDHFRRDFIADRRLGFYGGTTNVWRKNDILTPVIERYLVWWEKLVKFGKSFFFVPVEKKIDKISTLALYYNIYILQHLIKLKMQLIFDCSDQIKEKFEIFDILSSPIKRINPTIRISRRFDGEHIDICAAQMTSIQRLYQIWNVHHCAARCVQ
mgnify:CR=1 FL=1